MLYIFMYNIHLSTCRVVSQLQLTCFQHTNGIHTKLERHSVDRIYLRQWSFNASKVQNHTSQQAADNHAQYLYVGFSWCNKIQNVAVHAISEKVIRFQHPDYDPDRAQKLISSICVNFYKAAPPPLFKFLGFRASEHPPPWFLSHATPIMKLYCGDSYENH